MAPGSLDPMSDRVVNFAPGPAMLPLTVLEQVRNGGGGMPAFQGTLSAKQIRDVSAWVIEEIAGGG